MERKIHVQIVETANEGILLLDDKGRTTFVNASLAKSLGYGRSEMIGRSFFEFIDETVREEVRGKFSRRKEGVSDQYDCQFRRKDGSELWAIVSITAVVMGANDEQLGANTELQEAIRARDEFLSIASHELKTPMTPMKINLQSIERILEQESQGVPSREKIMKLLGGVMKALERLIHLVDELLDVARIRTGRLNLKLGELDVSVLVEEVVDHFREQLKKVGCTLSLSVEPGVLVMGDAFRIEEVVVNLLSNAIKFGAGAPIKVELLTEGDSAILKVQDHGIGISKDDQERIFNRFERAEPENNYGGMGLGLYIARQILFGHGGSIQVESQPGAGATFIVKTPLASGTR